MQIFIHISFLRLYNTIFKCLQVSNNFFNSDLNICYQKFLFCFCDEKKKMFLHFHCDLQFDEITYMKYSNVIAHQVDKVTLRNSQFDHIIVQELISHDSIHWFFDPMICTIIEDSCAWIKDMNVAIFILVVRIFHSGINWKLTVIMSCWFQTRFE